MLQQIGHLDLHRDRDEEYLRQRDPGKDRSNLAPALAINRKDQRLGGNRQPTLLYLRNAGAQSPKLDATEQYLNTILAMFAQDPSPRSDWPAAPFTFEQVVAEAVASLSQP